MDATALTVARIFQAAANVLALPVLARFLQPADFGLVAAANSILFLTSLLADAGFGNSLVRTSFDDKKVWSSVFWVTTAWSACLALLLAAIASPFAWLVKEPAVAPLIAVMAFLPLGQGLLAVPIADLQQRHRFGWISASDILGSLAGVAAAIFFAVAGAGPWALVAQPLTFLVVKAIVVSGSTRFRPSLAFDRQLIDEHLDFARNTSAFAVVHFFNAQMDNIMIARFIGAGPLGLYSMAYRIMSLPAILGTANNALYPRLIKLHNDKRALRQLVLVVTTVLAILIFPPMALLCTASKSIFTVLLSDRWSEAATVYSYLAPVGAFQAVSGIYALVLMAVGRTDIRLRLATEFVILWMIVLASTVHFGIQAVAIGLLLSYFAYYPRFLTLFLKPIECSVVEYLQAISVPLFVSTATALAHAALQFYFSFSSLRGTSVAICETITAYIVIVLFIWRYRSEGFASSRAILKRTDEES